MDKIKISRTLSSKLNLAYATIILVFLLSAFFPQHIKAQEFSIEQTEAEYKNLYGLDKLKALNKLTLYYYTQGSSKALKYARRARILSDNIFIKSNTVDPSERNHQIQAYLQLGKLYYDRKKYFESQKHLANAKSISEKINHQVYFDEAEIYLKKIQALIDAGEVKETFFSKTLSNLKIGQTINETVAEIKIEAEIEFGKQKEKNGNFLGAITNYKNAVNLLKNEGKTKKINELQLKIAILLDSLDQHVKAQQFLKEAISEIDTESTYDDITPEIDNSLHPLLDTKTVQVKNPQESLRVKQQEIKDILIGYTKEENFEQSLAYYKLYQELSQKMEEDSLKTVFENEQKTKEIFLLKQQKTVADLNVKVINKEKERQIQLRNTSIIITLLILISTLVTLYFYISKKREHKKLTIVHNDLNKTKSKLVDAEQRIIKLLKQQLSIDVATELLTNDSNSLGENRFVCIMFLDIRDFTSIAEKLNPEELINYQNNVFGFMIDIIQKYNGTINQLLGDGFMATFGAPVSHGNDCQNAFLAAKEILVEIKKQNDSKHIQETKIGIGLHAGDVVTGNVGNESRKQYSVTGNPVIIASRVEQLNKEYKTQLIITEEVHKNLDPIPEHSQPFIEVIVKGRSKSIKIMLIQ
ncbi:class 3 adenylate cyclase [Aquimarina sp. MAR_2010_214]|uniref:adenylate/guanylate cyclase domain-containing protein n=1 Tax=Aquimarina sp. MAR_2010_214 TaxID=1250026 RepID=UPI000C709643|nr:adenylate/guanylate cyclase domain-containing protein [Aquimarina sp. MAR_2010_214]PKV50134.1 class 3 adenylate cyclase [Aquimarina sp. MAR_2010_214]